MFDPPSATNWHYTGKFDQCYADAYKEGYDHGGQESDNPHKLSGHERDTTFQDELNYWWYSGFSDGVDSKLEARKS